MKARKWRRQREDRPGRKRQALRQIEDKEWEHELRQVTASGAPEGDLPVWVEDDAGGDDWEVDGGA